MIKLNAGQNGCVRLVMFELRDFIEIGGIVFIAFEHHVFAGSNTKALTKIKRYSTDQKGWV